MERQLPDTISGINLEIYRNRALIDFLQQDIARYKRIISRLATENARVNNANSLPANDNNVNATRSDYDSDSNGSPSPYLVRNLARPRNQNYYSDKIEQANARILSCRERNEILIRHLDAMRLNQGSPHPDQDRWLPNRLGGSGSGKKKSKRKRSKSKSKTRKVKKEKVKHSRKVKKGKGKTFKK